MLRASPSPLRGRRRQLHLGVAPQLWQQKRKREEKNDNEKAKNKIMKMQKEMGLLNHPWKVNMGWLWAWKKIMKEEERNCYEHQISWEQKSLILITIPLHSVPLKALKWPFYCEWTKTNVNWIIRENLCVNSDCECWI